MSSDDDVSSGGFTISCHIGIVIACFIAMSIYNVLELNVIIFATFKRYNGLYFWCLMIATWGIAVHQIGFLLRDFKIITNPFVYLTIISPGWWAMVTGQSLVLYSRLHLIVHNQTWLRAVLAMIIINAIVGHITNSVLAYGAHSDKPNPFRTLFSISEKIQVNLFFVQELIISGLYIYETTRLIRATAIIDGNTSRGIMRILLYCSVPVIVLDITILGLEFSDLYGLQTAYKGFAYSMKLKIEFSILNSLVHIAQSRNTSGYGHMIRRYNIGSHSEA